MRLTRQAEIAVNVLALCAIRNPGTATTRETADSTGTTKNHAAQVVAKLSRAGYLEGVRGRHGGIRLAKPPSAINVGEVLRLADPMLVAVENDAAGNGASVGAFDMLRRAAVEAYLSTFDSFTIADLVAAPSGGRIGCLGCDLNLLIQRGRTVSRLISPVPGRLVPTASKHTTIHPA